MITDQPTVFARAGKQNALGRRVVRGILAASVAAVLILSSLAAWGLDRPRDTPKSEGADETIALQPIPYLESMPWLKKSNAGVKTLKVDTLLSPTLGPSGIKLIPEERDPGKPALS